MLKKLSAYPYIIWLLIFVCIPLISMAYFSVTMQQGQETVFTLSNFKDFFTNPIYIDVLMKSIVLAFQATVLCFIIGYPMAMILAEMKPKHRNLAVMLFILPMWMNFLIRTYAMMVILEENGILNHILQFLNLPVQNILYTEGAILLGMVYNFLPFMVLPIYTSLIKMDKGLQEAANDLGANDLVTFIKIKLPLSVPGIISGITMVFMPAVSTFVISDLLGGGKIMLIGNLIQQQFLGVYNWYFGAAISMILMVIILMMMGGLNQFSKKYETEKGGVNI